MTLLAEYPLSYEQSGLARRLLAGCLDGLILNIGVAVLLPLFNLGTRTGTPDIRHLALGMLIFWFYSAAMESSARQATLGKIALGILVTDLEGRPLSFHRAAVRAFIKIISILLFGVGFVPVAFTRRKQAVHDIIVGCQVIRRME